MKKIVGIIQEHMFTNDQIKRLESGLREIYRNHYSKEEVVVLWRIMQEGYAFSERKPSHATIILVEVDEGITQVKREELMDLCSQFLLNNFSVSPLDSLITVPNSSFVNQFLEAQRQRIDPAYR